MYGLLVALYLVLAILVLVPDIDRLLRNGRELRDDFGMARPQIRDRMIHHIWLLVIKALALVVVGYYLVGM